MVLPKSWLRPDILCASLLINIFALAMPIAVLQTYDRIIPNTALDTLTLFVVGLVVVTLLETTLKIVRANVLAWAGAGFEHKTNVHFLKRLLFLDTLIYNQHARGYFLSKLQSAEELARFSAGQSMIMLIDFPFAILFLMLIWFVCGPLVLIPMGLLLLYALVSVFLARTLGKKLRERDRLEQHRQNFLIESLGHVHTVKAMALEGLMLRRYERLQARSAESVAQVSFVNNLSQGLGTSVSQLGMVLVVGLGSAQVLASEMSMGALAAATMLTARAIQPGVKAMSLWTSLQSTQLAKQNVADLELLTQPKLKMSAADLGSKAVNQGLVRNEQGAIVAQPLVLEQVSYEYIGANKPILSTLNLTIHPHDSVAITGVNGSGKTTLAMLLAGYLLPSEGRITLGGVDLCELDTEDLRAYMSWAPQQGVLYEGTLLENMTLFRKGEVVEQALTLSRKLGLEALINRLPDGLETRVGNSAVEPLSQAMRQVVTLVRALVGHPHLIILDDINAAFDFRLDRHLYQYLMSIKGQKTLLILSNRPSFLRLCDQVYELKNGQLIDLRAVAQSRVNKAEEAQ